MKNFPSQLGRGLLACFVSSFALAATLSAVEVADIGSLEFDDLPSPDVQTGKDKSFKPKDWLEVEAPLKIPAQNSQQKEAGFLDRVMVKWYIAVKDNASKKTVLLTKDINHVNIPVDEEIFSSVYISPTTLKRLTGSDRAGKSAVEVVAVEVIVDGVKVGEATSKSKSGWWNSPSLSRGDRYPLLSKNETPFEMLWWDRYAEIEERR